MTKSRKVCAYAASIRRQFHPRRNTAVCSKAEYAGSCEFQWKNFRKTQLDSHTGLPLSSGRLLRVMQRSENMEESSDVGRRDLGMVVSPRSCLASALRCSTVSGLVEEHSTVAKHVHVEGPFVPIARAGRVCAAARSDSAAANRWALWSPAVTDRRVFTPGIVPIA